MFQFGNDLRIYNKATSRSDNFVGKSDYNCPENYELNGREKNFSISSFEAYEIII